jgi:cytochrome P450
VALRVLNAQMTGPELLLPSIVPTPNRWRLRQALRRLDPLVFRIIAERRASGIDHGDLLSSLLAAQDEDGSRMTDRQLRDEAMTIVLAGHETTALALTWTWYLLSQHPEAAASLRSELDTVLGGREPGVADVGQLPYAEAVINEAMRLYPPIFAIGREAIEPCDVGGHHLPAGSNVYIVLWVLQRDPRFFEQPNAFRPERWLDGLAHRLPRGAYFPFGGGPRLCIGQPFAQMEATLLLATIAQRFDLQLPLGQQVVPLPSLTTRPRDGLRMRLLHRRGRHSPTLRLPSVRREI